MMSLLFLGDETTDGQGALSTVWAAVLRLLGATDAVHLAGSGAGFFRLVRVTNRQSKLTVQFMAIQDDLLRVYCLNGSERHDEVAGILDVNHQFR